MAEYTSPLFGKLDFTPTQAAGINIFEYMPKTNRQEVIKRNDKGQVYQADLFVTYTTHAQARLSRGEILSYNYNGQQTILGFDTTPFAILAVPCIYGNLSETKEGAAYDGYWWRIKEYHENVAYYYYLVCHNKNRTSIPTSYANFNEKMNTYISGIDNSIRITQGINPGWGIRPALLRAENPQQTVRTNSPNNMSPSGAYNLDTAIERLEDMSNRTKVNAGTQEYGRVLDGTLAGIRTGISHWKDRSDSIYDEIWVWNVGAYMSSIIQPQNEDAHNVIGSFIASGFPIFNASDSFDEMVKYFQGEDYTADNETPPPDDWSTDWDIYVKGAQRPEIFITMKSPKIDEWLKSDENKQGVVKGDIAVEYRYREYTFDQGDQSDPLNLPHYDFTKYSLRKYVKDKYDDMRATDYISNIELNCPRITELFSSIESDATIDTLLDYYAELEFRLTYGKKYKSTWCRYEIGVIGSPSIPDFSKMKNIGEQADEWQDNSTVTLHYDEYPSGYDPFPIPPLPDLPPLPNVPDPTDPTPVPPGLNGIGLLSTTYKITVETARQLGNFFWGGDLFQKIKALNTSPIENVVGLQIMPININGSTSVIIVGDVDTNLNGDIISTVPIYDLGSIELKGRYQSFLDYEPYTSAFLYLPFVGFVRIDPVYFTNKTLSVKYSYDIVCGLCNAMLFADGVFVESHQGTCGINVPLISSNRAELQMGLITGLVSAGFDLASIGGIQGKGASVKKMTVGANVGLDIVQSVADYATGFHSQRQSNYSPSCIWSETRNCYLVIESANASHSSYYNHDKGRPCFTSASVGSLRGYTELSAEMDLSNISGATDAEKAEMRTILSGGFYA